MFIWSNDRPLSIFRVLVTTVILATGDIWLTYQLSLCKQNANRTLQNERGCARHRTSNSSANTAHQAKTFLNPMFNLLPFEAPCASTP
uniref:Putative secreted protein n=1 Tax=Ixodes ricinus TaxID=34613 RepID=A0A6B0UFY3_IXORI